MAVTDDELARLRAAYDAYRAGDLGPLSQLMDDHIRWIGDSSLGDPPPECNGRDEALQVLKRAAGRVSSRDLESMDLSGDRVFAVARWREGKGPEGRDRVYSLLTLRDGRIIRMEDFFDRSEAERALGKPQ